MALHPDYVGKYRIEIIAQYADNKNKTVKLKTFFFLTVKPAPFLPKEIEEVIEEL